MLPDRLTAGRAALAILAVSLVSLLFIGSYAGALHAPSPDEVPVAISAQVPQAAADQIDATPAFRVIRVATPAAAMRAIDDRKAYGALVVGRDGGLELVTAPAAGPAAQSALLDGLAPQLRSAVSDVRLRTVHALPKADGRGLVGFYTAVGWIVAGYLGATFLAIVFGTRPSTRRTLWRIGGLVASERHRRLRRRGARGLDRRHRQRRAHRADRHAHRRRRGDRDDRAAGRVRDHRHRRSRSSCSWCSATPRRAGRSHPSCCRSRGSRSGPTSRRARRRARSANIAYFPDASLGKAFIVLGAWILVGAVAALLLSRGRHSPGEREHALAAVAAP